MARSITIFTSIYLFIVLTAGAGTAQSTAPGSSKKAGAAGVKTTAAATGKAAPAAKPAASAVAAPLSAEVKRRILTEIRSRYSVPEQINIALAEPKPGNTNGYDDLMVTFSGGTHTTTHEFLISSDRKTLAHLEKIDISQDLMSKIDLKGRPVRGNADARVTIINFDDFQCPFCSRMHSTIFDNVFKDYASRIRVIYKDYPLQEIHPWAMHAAIDGNCLGEQNSQAYWDFADYVHANQRVVAGKSRTEAFANLDGAAKDQATKHQLDQGKLQACVQKQDETAVRASIAEGDKLGIDSTPTLFINGEKLLGVVPEQELRAILDRALADSGQQAPADAKK